MIKALWILLMMSPVLGQGDALFPLPDILKDNFDFWMRIFTEVSVEEGLLHDQEYPAAVFEKVHIGKGSSRRSKTLRTMRKSVAAALQRLENLPDSAWSQNDRRYLALYQGYGGKKAVKGAYQRLRFQKGLREKFLRGLERSTQYLDTIRAILKQEGIPLRLAYLPHVESSFNINAGSKVGAMGMWQFMRSTGRLFMRIDYLIDERRDPIRSTIAAARLLKKNFDVLKSWPLAITAYNHGLYGMKRAVAATGTNDISVIVEKYKSRRFRYASKNFYSSFLAASAIAAEPELWFPNIISREKYRVQSLVLPNNLRPLDLCNALGIDEAEFRRLNPAFRPVVFTYQKLMPAGYTINLPADSDPHQALSSLAALADSIKFQQPALPEYYTVARGDNLYKISRNLGTSVRELVAVNNIDRRNRIYPGQVLRIPEKEIQIARRQVKAVKEKKQLPPKRAEDAPADTEFAGGRALAERALSSTPGVKSASAPDKKPETGEPEAIPDYFADTAKPLKSTASPRLSGAEDSVTTESLTVRPDTLDEIAAAVALPASAPGSDGLPVISNRFDAEIYQLEIAWDKKSPSAFIRATADETVGHYAEWLDVSTRRVRRFNRFKALKNIHIGQKIFIPMRSQNAREKFATARLEHHMSIEEDFYQQYQVENFKRRGVGVSENVWKISESESVPIWLLKKYNPLMDFANMQAGDSLWIPLVIDLEENNQIKNAL